MSTVALQTGLEINTQKTKSMRVNIATDTLIQIAEQNIEDVESFIYLGSIISKTWYTGEDIKSRIGKPRHVYFTLKPVWNNRNILLKTKLTIFSSNVKSVFEWFVIRFETWKHTKALDSKLQVVWTPAYHKSSVLDGLTPFPMKNSGEERNRDQFQRMEMAVGWAYRKPGPNKDHKTGTPKVSAGEVVQPRLGKEP